MVVMIADRVHGLEVKKVVRKIFVLAMGPLFCLSKGAEVLFAISDCDVQSSMSLHIETTMLTLKSSEEQTGCFCRNSMTSATKNLAWLAFLPAFCCLNVTAHLPRRERMNF